MILGRAGPPGRIAVVHPQAGPAEAIARVLRPAGHRLRVFGQDVEDPEALTQAVVESAPDLVVGSLALAAPPLGRLVRSLRRRLGEVPVLVLIGEAAREEIVEADALLHEPVVAGELSLAVSSILRNRKEQRDLRQRVRELSGLDRLSWVFSLEAGSEALFGRLAQRTAELLRAQRGLVLLYDPKARELAAQPRGHGLTPEQVETLRFPSDGEAARLWHFRRNGPLLSNDAAADPRLLPGLARALGLRNVVVSPVLRGDRVLGLLAVADRHGSPFDDDDLQLLGAVSNAVGVALESHLLHEELKRANALLREYDRSRSEFMAMVAHDFRRPLTAIRGFAELLLDEVDVDRETRREYMRTVVAETDGLARLADDALLASQMEDPGFRFEWQELDLGALLLEVAPLGLSEHALHVEVPPDFPRVVADGVRLRQLLTNLLSNALKYSPAGGTVAVRCRERRPSHILIEVSDQGLGIPAEQLGHLFRKFRRVRSSAHLAVEGTGLGLYICRLIVEGHGGHIWAESSPGRGSTFHVLLPRDARLAAAGGCLDAHGLAAEEARP